MKVCITGATGYIGSRVAEKLLAQGYQVNAIVRGQSNVGKLEVLGIGRYVYDGTITSLTDAFADCGATQVVHVSSLYLARHNAGDIGRLVEANILFPTNLLEAMHASGINEFVNVGTSWQHFEGAPYNPANLYAATKQAFEDLLGYYVNAHGFKAITLKLYDTYGPGDKRPKLLGLLRQTAKAGDTLKMSPGKQEIDLVYIDDVLNAFALALHRVGSISGAESYGVSSGLPINLCDLVALYIKVTGHAVNVDWGSLAYRPREVMEPWKKAPRLPGWNATIGLAEGIRRMEEDAAIGGLLAEQIS